MEDRWSGDAHYPRGADNGLAIRPLVVAGLLAALLLVEVWIDSYGITL